MEQITREQAQACLDAIETQFPAYAGQECTCGQPLLAEPGAHCSGWAIVWECHSPYEWTYKAFHGGFDEEMFNLTAEFGQDNARRSATVPAVACPAGVFAEPVNRCVLGLFVSHREGR